MPKFNDSLKNFDASDYENKLKEFVKNAKGFYEKTVAELIEKSDYGRKFAEVKFVKRDGLPELLTIAFLTNVACEKLDRYGGIGVSMDSRTIDFEPIKRKK
jgi:hypothetical protein